MNHFLDSDIENIVDFFGKKAGDLAGKKILIAGSGGFLGRYWLEVFRRLNNFILDEPCKVIALDNFITGIDLTELYKDENFTFIKHNIIEPIPTDIRCDYVIHSAGIASPYHYRAHPMETLEVSTTGTKHLLNLAHENGAKLIFFSSSEIYGDPDPKHVPTAESYRGNVSTMGPRSCYDEGKRVGETLCYIFHEMLGVNVNVIRPFNVFGPGMKESDYRVLPSFASRILSGAPVCVYGSGQQTRTYCYVEDAIKGFMLVLLRGVPGQVYNIGNPKPEVSVFGLLEYIQEAIGKSVEYRQIEYPDSYPSDEPARRCPDIRKAQIQLDYNPEVGLLTGLQRFFAWAGENFNQG